MKKTIIPILLMLALLFTGCTNANTNVGKEIESSCNYIHSMVGDEILPGMEWEVILLQKADQLSEEKVDNYYNSLEKLVKEKKGILDKRNYTEYSRTIITLETIGKDPQNIGGYDLTKKLEDFNQVCMQGINGAMWALIALNSGEYNKTEISEKYIAYILDHQLKDGGWDFSNIKADPDMTSMAITALSKHLDNPKVAQAVDRGVEALSKLQKNNGHFESWGEESAESCAQVIIALCSLGINPIGDERFVKEKNLIETLLTYQTDEGGFVHTAGGEVNGISTEQGLLALEAYELLITNQSGVYEGENK